MLKEGLGLLRVDVPAFGFGHPSDSRQRLDKRFRRGDLEVLEDVDYDRNQHESNAGKERDEGSIENTLAGALASPPSEAGCADPQGDEQCRSSEEG